MWRCIPTHTVLSLSQTFMPHTILSTSNLGAPCPLDEGFFMNGIVVAPSPPGERSSFYRCAWCNSGSFNYLEILRSHVNSKSHRQKQRSKYQLALGFARGYPQGISLQENLSTLDEFRRVRTIIRVLPQSRRRDKFPYWFGPSKIR